MKRHALEMTLLLCVAPFAMGCAFNGGPDLLYEASTTGELGPGDYRQITANGEGRQRVYRASVDARGRLTEVYRDDGQVRPIDARVRSWLAEVARENASLSPPPEPPCAPAD